MSSTVLDMSISLDGFIAGPNAGPATGLERRPPSSRVGLDQQRCRPASASAARRASTARSYDEMLATGAVVAGRGTFEPAGGWRGDHHDGVPIFILYRRKPEIDIGQWPLVTPVNDVASAMTQAKEAAGAKDVLVHGAGVARLALTAGVLDELELHVVPVLLGQGRRLFDGLAAEQIEFERTRILEGENGITHLRYQVRR